MFCVLLRSVRVGSLLVLSGTLAAGTLAASASGQERPVDLYGDRLPPGATARLGTVRFTHARDSTGVAFLPDNSTLVTASEERSIRCWDAQTGVLLREFRTDPMSIRRFAISS